MLKRGGKKQRPFFNTIKYLLEIVWPLSVTGCILKDITMLLMIKKLFYYSKKLDSSEIYSSETELSIYCTSVKKGEIYFSKKKKNVLDSVPTTFKPEDSFCSLGKR